jgi:cytochrome c556
MIPVASDQNRSARAPEVGARVERFRAHAPLLGSAIAQRAHGTPADRHGNQAALRNPEIRKR